MRRLVILTVGLCVVFGALLMGQDGEPVGDPGSAAVAAPSSDVEPVKQVTLFELLLKGGPLMYPLCLCSIIMVAFGVERAVSLRRKKVLPPVTVRRVREVTLLRGGELQPQQLRREFDGQSNPIARIMAVGLRRVGRPVPEIEKAIEDAGAREAANMRRNCKALSVVASVAPLLGLLGTVLGMIRAFMTVAAREEALGRTELLAAGIYQALVTTAAGLTIAIPALVLYYFFVERVDRLVSEIDDMATDLVEALGTGTE